MQIVARSERQVAAAIRRFRKVCEMSQTDLAGQIGKRQATISNLESGAGTLKTFFAVLAALELELVVRQRRRNEPNQDIADLF